MQDFLARVLCLQVQALALAVEGSEEVLIEDSDLEKAVDGEERDLVVSGDIPILQ